MHAAAQPAPVVQRQRDLLGDRALADAFQGRNEIITLEIDPVVVERLREERGATLDAADHSAVTRLDEQEVSVLEDVAYAAEVVNDSL